MRHSRKRIVFDGAIAGLLGATTVALWFLIFDASRGRILETPALLAATLLHGSHGAALPASLAVLVSEYSILHFAAFLAVGICGALVLEATEDEPALIFSLLIFFAAFEIFFVAIVMFLGPAVMAALTWWGILVANLLATGVMLTYFFARHPSLARKMLGPWLGVMREGVVAGLWGALVVALWFLIYDAVAGEIFRTPAMLGATIFRVALPVEAGTASAALVVGYTVLHFFAFIVFGMAAATMFAATEREPLLAIGVLVVFVCFEVFFLGFVTLLDASLLQMLGWWKITLGNLLALGVIVAYLLHRHRGLPTRLVERWARLDREGAEDLGELPGPHGPGRGGTPRENRPLET